jgi:DNA-binding MarR family transcriptional regulator
MRSRTPPAGDPSHVLGYLLKRAHQRLGALADAALQPLGVDRKEFGVLRVLAGSEPLSQRRVAANLGIDPTTMVGLIDALEAKGILTRRPDLADRRRNAIEFTTTGRETYRRADAAYAAAEREFLASLSGAQAEQFRQALRAVLAADVPPGARF